MKKKVVIIAVAVLVLVVFAVGGYWGMKDSFSPQEEKKDPKSSIVMFRTDKDDIRKITVSGWENYELNYTDNRWNVLNQSITLSEEKMEEYLLTASTLYALEVADRDADNLSEYGLDPDKPASLSVFDEKELLYTLFIGTVSDNRDYYYVMLEGDNDVYKMYRETVQTLLQSPDKLRERKLHSMSTDDLSADRYLKRYRVQKAGELVTDIRAKTDEEMLQYGNGNSYLMLYPYQREAEQEVFEQQIMVQIPMLEILDFVETNPADLRRYGLDTDQRITLTLEAADQTLVLHLGRTESGKRYVLKEGSNEVVTVKSETLDFLNSDPFFLLESSIYTLPVEEIDRLNLTSKDGQYEISVLEDGEGARQYFVNGAAVDTARFEEWYNTFLRELKFSGKLSAEQSAREPEVRIIASVPEQNTQITVDFYSANTLQYAVHINAEQEFSVEKSKVEQVFDALKQLYENPNEKL